MAQVAIYIDDQLLKKLDQRVKEEKISRSAWIATAITHQITDTLPESWFKTLGTWEDDRKPEQILADIRKEIREKKREVLR